MFIDWLNIWGFVIFIVVLIPFLYYIFGQRDE